MHTSIESALSVLNFSSETGNLPGQATFEAYQALARDNFQELVTFLGNEDPRFFDEVSQSPFYEDRGFLISPEIWNLSNRVDRNRQDYLRKFIRTAIYAEAARAGQPERDRFPLWTVNGEYFINQNASQPEPFVFEAPLLLGRVPMDFLSPYCAFLSNDQVGEPDDAEVTNYEFSEIEALVGHFMDTLAPVEEGYPQVARFIRDYTRHLVLKVNPNALFTSGSNKTFIGRTVVTGAEKISRELLADAMVHEAAHSYLYMLEELQPWMPSWEISNNMGLAVASTWTGNKITLVSFSQAIFIWYTLFHFWTGCRERGLYDPEFIEKRLQTIQDGFRKLDLDELQKTARGTVPNTTMQTFVKTRASVLDGQYSPV